MNRVLLAYGHLSKAVQDICQQIEESLESDGRMLSHVSKEKERLERVMDLKTQNLALLCGAQPSAKGKRSVKPKRPKA